MYIKGKVDKCDFDDIEYGKMVDGAHMLARGATGRVCAVMWAGPEYLKRNNIELTSREDAEAWALNHHSGCVDF
jgi:hypothetical protein